MAIIFNLALYPEKLSLVNKKTFERECIKVGIAAGKDWRHVVKRSYGFKGYDLRIQRTWSSTLYRVWEVEQSLHKEYENDRFQPSHKFGGHTECFNINSKIFFNTLSGGFNSR